uniref:Potassium calcium-activated channel subfamily U member 1 n=1 Tax=Crocodylus porosus TaxID=8502 RepID=A0A7M4E3J6_CROPO
ILWKGAFHERVQMMLSAQTFVGRVLVIHANNSDLSSLRPIEYFSSFPDETLPVDMGFNTFFLFYFGLRFLAADDKLKFWLELNSIVDFFTIPPVCASYYLKRNWLGFRFLRALRLLELPKILQFLKITKTSNSIKLVKLLAVFLSTWLTSAGFIHLVENSGDPWINYDNSQFLSYFDCLYLIMATMSTVGYGDVVAKTCLGRVSMIFFIIGGLVLFANFIPEIADVVGSNKKYEGSYKVVKGRKYIVVCGNITLESVTAFLRDFLPQDTGDICTEILFLGESLPSLELEAVFNCYSPYTTFFHGSALNDEDLKRVQVRTPFSFCPFHFMAHSFVVLSIKNHCPNTRVIIQIIQSHNKVAYLPNIPNWDWRIGDSIICFAELKLGFIAQSCLVPGLSTLLTSLFVRNESVKRKSMRHRNVLKGSAYQVMTYKLSNDFVGMSFPEVCRILINPSAKIMLHRNVMGFFIAKSMAEVKRAHFYCKACHSDIDNPKLIEKCHCRSKLRRRSIGGNCPLNLSISYNERLAQKSGHDLNSDAMLDSTGMFHWCHAVSLEKAILKEATSDLHDHIVVCVFGDANTTLIGLRDFVMPLRASNFTYEELRDIVFVGSLEYLKREWGFIQNFPKLCALSCADLKAVNIRHCAMCAILSYSSKSSTSPILVDTESILATLNIRAMQFKCSTVSEGKSVLYFIGLTSLPFCSAESTSNAHFIDQSAGSSGSQIPEQELHLSTPFSSGAIFSDSFLDSLLSTVRTATIKGQRQCQSSMLFLPAAIMSRTTPQRKKPQKKWANLETGLSLECHLSKQLPFFATH